MSEAPWVVLISVVGAITAMGSMFGWAAHKQRHQHSWRTIARTFRPPTGTIKHARNLDEDLALQLTYGITTVTQQCAECGIERSYTVAGEVGDVSRG
jgi:hypothetical protein